MESLLKEINLPDIFNMRIKNFRHSLFSLFIAFLFLGISDTHAQNFKLELAKYHIDQFDYKTAAEIYQDVLEKHPFNEVSIRQIAFCYQQLNKNTKAEQAYEMLDSLRIRNIKKPQKFIKNTQPFFLEMT